MSAIRGAVSSASLPVDGENQPLPFDPLQPLPVEPNLKKLQKKAKKAAAAAAAAAIAATGIDSTEGENNLGDKVLGDGSQMAKSLKSSKKRPIEDGAVATTADGATVAAAAGGPKKLKTVCFYLYTIDGHSVYSSLLIFT